MEREFDRLLERSRRAVESARDGDGGPGPVNWVIGRIARSTSRPGWNDFHVRDELADHYGVPAVVDNDANLLGLGEQRQVYPEAYLVLLMKVGTGIGASVVLDRELLRGSESAEG